MVENISIKERIYDISERRPFAFGLVSTVLIFILSFPIGIAIGTVIAIFAVQLLGIWSDWVMNVIIRMAASLIGIWVLGAVLKTNGLNFVFSLKGFAKCLLALSPMIIIIFVIPFVLIDEIGRYSDIVSYFPSIIIIEFARGLQEEVLFRGVLMTAVLVSLSPTWDNKSERIIYALIFAAIFGLLHFTSWLVIFIAFSGGLLLCAAYIYTKNLLACVIVHWMSNALTAIIWGLMTGNFDWLQRILALQTFELALMILFCIIQIITAIILIIKAKPFVSD